MSGGKAAAVGSPQGRAEPTNVCRIGDFADSLEADAGSGRRAHISCQAFA